MSQVRSNYAKKLSTDPVVRQQIAVMRLAGFSCEKIAEVTERHPRTIITEIRRLEHKKIIRSCVSAIGKKRLPAEVWEEVENEMDKREKK